METPIIIDVRSPAEYADMHIDGAINIDVMTAGFADGLASLDPARPYVVYCRSGARAARAQEWMTRAGFIDVTNGRSLADLRNLGHRVLLAGDTDAEAFARTWPTPLRTV